MNELRIDPKWRWAAMDEDGEWFFYEDVPSVESDDNSWSVAGNNFQHVSVFILNKHIDWRNSLHEIVHEDGRAFLRKHVDVPGDGEPVIVWDDPNRQHRRYSAGRLDSDGLLRCYEGGKTRWTTEYKSHSGWSNWRRPTAEELEG